MGQKSRSKKNRSQHVANASKKATARGGAMPASLQGMAYQPANAQVKNGFKTDLADVQSEYIRSDIIRILLLLVIVEVLIAIAYLVGEKTQYLTKAGAVLTQFLRLQ